LHALGGVEHLKRPSLDVVSDLAAAPQTSLSTELSAEH
jgi:hypothetical protein